MPCKKLAAAQEKIAQLERQLAEEQKRRHAAEVDLKVALARVRALSVEEEP